jgi:hypothetical protein
VTAGRAGLVVFFGLSKRPSFTAHQRVRFSNFAMSCAKLRAKPIAGSMRRSAKPRALPPSPPPANSPSISPSVLLPSEILNVSVSSFQFFSVSALSGGFATTAVK